MTTNYEIIKNGLWYNNPGIVQLLGLCPLLAVSNNIISSIALGIATIFVLTSSNILVSLIKNHIDYNLRIPYFMLTIASLVTLVIFTLKAISYELYQSLGVYLALITTNCVILGRVEAFAYKNNSFKAGLDGLFNGLGFGLVLIILGGLREIIGQGTLFSNANLLFGDFGNSLTINLNTQSELLIALLPPGAFIILGLLIALKNYLQISSTNKYKSNEQRTAASDIPTISTKKP